MSVRFIISLVISYFNFVFDRSVNVVSYFYYVFDRSENVVSACLVSVKMSSVV